MKKLLLISIIILISVTTGLSLEPVKVAIVTTSGNTLEVNVELYDYGTNTSVYSQGLGTLTANSSGIISFIVEGGTPAWSSLDHDDVNSQVVLNVMTGPLPGTLYAQYRIDALILTQAQNGILDQTGDLAPPSSGSGDVGTDALRWSSGYFESNTVHIGPPMGETNNTEMALSYDNNTNTGTITVDNEDVIDATKDVITINKLVSQEIGNNNTAFGTGALKDNTGQYVVGVGTNAARENSGDYVNASGYYAAFFNSGDFVNASGFYAASFNIGDNLNASGVNAARENTGYNVNASGNGAALANEGNNVNASGLNAARKNSGSNVVAIGQSAGWDGTNGNSLSGQVIFSNVTLPEYADRIAATTAITVANGAVRGNTYMYYNTATNTIEAVRLP